MNELQRICNLLADCYFDPDLFNSAILGRNPLWWRQREAAQSVCDYRQTIVYSGNSIGKDYLLGCIVPWWLYTRANSMVVVTGPSQTLLGSVTWKEIRLACDNPIIPLKPKVSAGVKSSPQVCAVDAKRGWQALGYSTTNVERASGQHNRKLLVVVEEASGVPDEIWGALDSLKYVRLLAIGNPIRHDGEFVTRIRQAQKDRRDGIPRHRSINAIRIPSTDSPHIDLDESPFGLADKTWYLDLIRRYGRDSLYVKSHVDAIIPDASSDVLITEALLDFAAAQTRPELPIFHPVHQTRRIATDLGEGVGRDSTCVLVRDDLSILEVIVSASLGLPGAAWQMAELGRRYNVPATRMSYDKLGIGRDLGPHLAANGIEAAIGYAGEASPRDVNSFTNLRTEAAWQLKNRLDPSFVADVRDPHASRIPFSIPNADWWPRLRDELKPLSYSLVGKKTQLLTKKDWAAILGHSPDIADALIQSFAY